jgi:hypothetical protein
MQSIDDLAREITSLDPAQQRALIDKVAQLNLQKGLRDLSDRYRRRLMSENRLDIPPEQVWAELHRIRDEIIAHDYPA